MTEPGAPLPDDADDDIDATDPVDAAPADSTADNARPSFQLGEALGRLKRDGADADDQPVSSDARTRMSWSSVTEAEPEPERTVDASTPAAASPAESSFRFDLGSALARVGDPPSDGPPAAAPPETSAPPPSPAPTRPVDAEEPPPSAASTPSAVAPTPPAAPPAAPVAPPTAPPSPTATPPPPAATPAATPPPVTPQASPAADELPRREPSSGQLPRRGAPTPVPADQLPRRRAEASPPSDDLPQRRSSAPTAGATGGGDAAVEPRRPPTETSATPTDRSIFDNANPAPSLPRNPQRTPSPEPTSPVLPSGTTAALPTLPASNPAVPPPIVETPSSPSGPDVHAVRSFELKAKRDRRRSRFMWLMFVVLAMLAVAVAVALLFGRSWLFPTQWSEDLIPVVDQIELENGAEFNEPVAVEELPVVAYAAAALEATLGDDWAAAYPQWRALGLASGVVDDPALAEAVAAWRPAVYDAERGVIYRVASDRAADAVDATTEATDATAETPDATAGATGATGTTAATVLDEAIRLALLQAFDDQRGIGPSEVEGTAGILGVSSQRNIAARAIDRALLVGSTDVPTFGADTEVALPLLYEMVAVDVFGEPIIAASDLDPAPVYGDAYPDDVLDSLVSDYPMATLGSLPADAEPLGEPVALGPDAWALVWQNRLPEPTAVRLRALVTADVYQPFLQSGKGCVAAAFETQSDINAGEVVTALTAWATAAPLDAAPTISISTTDPARVEFVTCDPGATAEQTAAPSTVTSLIERQLDALGEPRQLQEGVDPAGAEPTEPTTESTTG